jgi:hypothetical protein
MGIITLIIWFLIAAAVVVLVLMIIFPVFADARTIDSVIDAPPEPPETPALPEGGDTIDTPGLFGP